MLPVCVPLLVLLAQAQPDPRLTDPQAKAKAQSLLAEGNALYDEGKAAAALDKFVAAYRAFPSSKIYLNIAQASLDLGRSLDAAVAFEKFLAEPSGAPPDAVAEARRSLGELQHGLGRLRVEAMPGVEVVVDGKSEGTTPLSAAIWVTPGIHRVKFDHVDYLPMGRQIEVKAGASELVVLRQKDLPAPHLPGAAQAPSLGTAAVAPPRQDGRGGITDQRWFWPAVGGVAVLLGVVGVYAATAGRTTKTPETSLGVQQAFQ